MKQNSPRRVIPMETAQNHPGIWSQGISFPFNVHVAANADGALINKNVNIVNNFSKNFMIGNKNVKVADVKDKTFHCFAQFVLYEIFRKLYLP